MPLTATHSAISDVGRRRAHNEDRYCTDPTLGLFVVCDGMGGMEHGDLASETAVRAMLNAYALKTPDESIPQALERSVREANQRVIEAALLRALEGAAVLKRDEPLSRHTTIGIGGTVEAYVVVSSAGELRQALRKSGVSAEESSRIVEDHRAARQSRDRRR